MKCEACENEQHELCGMQTWCECDCAGPDGIYVDGCFIPDGYYFRDDLDGGRLVKMPKEKNDGKRS